MQAVWAIIRVPANNVYLVTSGVRNDLTLCIFQGFCAP